MKDKIKKLYQEAGELLHQAKAILEEFEGKETPTEKAEEYDRLMDAFDAKTDEAKRLERMVVGEEEIKQPVNGLPTPAGAKPEPEEAKAISYRGHNIPVLQPEVKAAWNRYLKGGERALSAQEAKALQADSDTIGGFLVAPQQFVARLLQAVDNATFIRQLATVYTVTNAESLGVPSLDTDIADAAWTVELGIGTEDSSIALGKRQLSPHPLAKYVKISNKLLRQSSIDVEGLVRSRLAYKFGVVQENAFLNGDGSQQPLGVFTASALGISTAADTTAAAAAAIAADDLINTKHDLKAQYWPRARWIMNRAILKTVRKLKDGTGQYLWQPGLASDLPAAILDVPYLISEYAPSSITTGKYVAIIGDFSFYWIVDALSMQVQVLNELYAATNQTGYVARAELDGMPVLEEAFRRLVMA